MPKQTYNNLIRDKKERIFNAGLLEFSYHDKNDASVNNIVRIANISKGSFYQYFDDKDEFYWYIVMEIIFGRVGTYEKILRKNDGDFFKTEETLFDSMINLFDDTKYRNLIKNVFKTNYIDLKSRISGKGSVIYYELFDLLMGYGFKGYNIKTKDDFLIVFELVRNIANNTILTMISDGLSKLDAKELYKKKLLFLSNGIKKRGFF